MRTTIRIDDDLFAELKTEAARTGRTLTQVVEDAVREFLARKRSVGGGGPRSCRRFAAAASSPGSTWTAPRPSSTSWTAVLLADVNVLVYAHREDAPQHARFRDSAVRLFLPRHAPPGWCRTPQRAVSSAPPRLEPRIAHWWPRFCPPTSGEPRRQLTTEEGTHRLVGEGADGALADRFLKHLKTRRFSPATARAHAHDLLNFTRFLAERDPRALLILAVHRALGARGGSPALAPRE